jgi:hypothetical protein
MEKMKRLVAKFPGGFKDYEEATLTKSCVRETNYGAVQEVDKSATIWDTRNW